MVHQQSYTESTNNSMILNRDNQQQTPNDSINSNNNNNKEYNNIPNNLVAQSDFQAAMTTLDDYYKSILHGMETTTTTTATATMGEENRGIENPRHLPRTAMLRFKQQLLEATHASLVQNLTRMVQTIPDDEFHSYVDDATLDEDEGDEEEEEEEEEKDYDDNDENNNQDCTMDDNKEEQVATREASHDELPESKRMSDPNYGSDDDEEDDDDYMDDDDDDDDDDEGLEEEEYDEEDLLEPKALEQAQQLRDQVRQLSERVQKIRDTVLQRSARLEQAKAGGSLLSSSSSISSPIGGSPLQSIPPNLAPIHDITNVAKNTSANKSPAAAAEAAITTTKQPNIQPLIHSYGASMATISRLLLDPNSQLSKIPNKMQLFQETMVAIQKELQKQQQLRQQQQEQEPDELGFSQSSTEQAILNRANELDNPEVRRRQRDILSSLSQSSSISIDEGGNDDNEAPAAASSSNTPYDRLVDFLLTHE